MHDSMIRLHEVSGVKRKKDIAKQLDISPSTVTNWSARGVSKEGALAAAELYNTDANYILTGAEKKKAKELYNELLSIFSEKNLESNIEASLDKVAILSRVSKNYVDESEIEGYQARPFHLTRCIAFRVSAQSMSPVFVTDDIAYIDLVISKSDLKDGCYVLAIANDEKYASIKKVTHGASADDMYLSHINTDIPRSEMRKIDDFEVIGIVDSRLTSFR